jgi:hypothetical protein
VVHAPSHRPLSEPRTELPAVRPVPDRLPWTLWPLQRHRLSRPICDEPSSSRRGSARGCSQPLSGFLADSWFAALFRAAAVPETLPCRGFPSRGSRAPLEAACSLAVIRRLPGRTVWTLSARVSSSPAARPRMNAPRRRPPPRLWAPFRRAEAHVPVPLDPARRAVRSADFTRFEAFLPARVRSHRPELPRLGGRSSPGVAPL